MRGAVLICAGFIGTSLLVGAGGRAGSRSGPLPDQRPLRGWVTDFEDGSVMAVAGTGSRVYVGGYIHRLAPPTGPVALVSARSGSPESRFPEFAGDVERSAGSIWKEAAAVDAIVDDGLGGWFVAGTFAYAGGLECSRLAHVRADLSIDRRFCMEPNGAVVTLARHGPTLYLGGLFTRIAGTARGRLAALDIGSGRLLAWAPKIGGPTLYDRSTPVPNSVNAIVARGSTIYIGGLFGRVDGVSRHNLAAVDTATGRVLSWSADIGDYFGTVNALAVDGGRVYVGGAFHKIGSASRSGLAAVDTSAGTVLGWNPEPSLPVDPYYGTVVSIVVTRPAVYIGGGFSKVGGQPRRGFAAVDALNGRPLALRADADGIVRSIALTDDRVYIGGDFTHLAGRARTGLAAVARHSGSVLAWNPAPVGAVAAIETTGDGVMVGGYFTAMSPQSAPGLAAIDRNGKPVPGWHVLVDGSVASLALRGDTLYLGGDFHHVGGMPREGLAAVSTTTGRVLGWDPRLGEHNYGVTCIAPAGDVIYVGGDFYSVGGVPQQAVAALDTATGAVKDWRPLLRGTNTSDHHATVNAIAVVGGAVYVGGGFDLVAGAEHAPVAAFDAATGNPKGWNPVISTAEGEEVYALTVGGGVLYAGGTFSSVDHQTRHDAAAFDLATGRLTRWAPNVGSQKRFADISALAVDGDDVYLGGHFEAVNGVPRDGIAIVDTRHGSTRSWNVAVPDVTSISLAPNRLYLGGSFTHAGPTTQTGIAIFPR